MSLPRFYQITLEDRRGAPQALSIDLLDPGAVGDTPGVIRSLATTVRDLGTAHRARTTYAEVPGPTAVMRPLWAYAWGDGCPNPERLRRHLASLAAGGEVHAFIVRPGNWAEGADLVGREELVASLTSNLSSGGRIHLMAPRRYGKTSLLRAVGRRLSDSRVVVRADVESVESIAGLLVRVVDEAFQVTDALRSIDELRAWPGVDASARVRADACAALRARSRTSPTGLLEQVCRVLGEDGAVLLLDELTRFVLETLPQEPRPAFLEALDVIAGTPGLAIMACGSQGLRAFVEWHDLAPLRALESVALGALEQRAASSLVEELFYGDRQPPVQDAVDAVLEAVGAPIPYFLHGLVHHTVQEHRSRPRATRGPIVRATVSRAYERRLLDQEGNEFFRPYRLKERGYPDALRRPAAAILRSLSSSSQPVAVASLQPPDLADESFAHLMAALAEDYDVVIEADEARLRSKVIRERWARQEAWLRGGDE